MRYKVLVIEDNPADTKIVAALCAQAGFQGQFVASGEEGVEKAKSWKPDMVLLDIGLPGISGREVCRLLRQDKREHTFPIIMVSAMKDKSEILSAFSAGADDYVPKPYEPEELLARISAVLRRYYRKPNEDEIIRVGDIVINVASRKVESGGENVKLTSKEFGLLEVLMKKTGRVLSRQFLLEYVWGYDEEIMTRTIDMHIARLRNKLGKEGRNRIQTVERFGYRFSDEASD